ncbi:putative HVA22-like protein g [Tanacetum coccineum]
MIGSFLTRGLEMVFGYAYPAYECFKSVEKNKPDIEQLRFFSVSYWILRLFVSESLVEGVLLDERVVGLAMVVEMPETHTREVKSGIQDSVNDWSMLEKDPCSYGRDGTQPNVAYRSNLNGYCQVQYHVVRRVRGNVEVSNMYWLTKLEAMSNRNNATVAVVKKVKITHDLKGTELKKKLRENGFHENLVAFLDWESDDEYNYYAYEEVGATLAENTRANLQ